MRSGGAEDSRNKSLRNNLKNTRKEALRSEGNTRNLVENRFLKKELSTVSNAEKKSSKKWLVNQTIDLELGFRLQKTRLLATKKKSQISVKGASGGGQSEGRNILSKSLAVKKRERVGA